MILSTLSLVGLLNLEMAVAMAGTIFLLVNIVYIFALNPRFRMYKFDFWMNCTLV
jgi:hypothetical protein